MDNETIQYRSVHSASIPVEIRFKPSSPQAFPLAASIGKVGLGSMSETAAALYRRMLSP